MGFLKFWVYSALRVFTAELYLSAALVYYVVVKFRRILGGFLMNRLVSRRGLSRVWLVLSTIAVCAAVLVSALPSTKVLADGYGELKATNCWGSGGQAEITLNCPNASSVTVVVEFSGSVSSASGWGFDSYSVSGSQVTATVSAGGPNSWGLTQTVGIQVEGSGVESATLISITADNSTVETGSGAGGNGNSGNGGNCVNGGDSGNGGNGAGGTSGNYEVTVETGHASNVSGVAGDDWLTTDGSKIVDMNGTEVWITGVNWFGYNTGTNIFDGCWSCDLKGALKAIADHGFNFLRIPMSAELLLQWKSGVYPQANYNQATNAYLNGMNSLEIFDYVLELCEENGLKVMIDIHSAETDASGHNAPLWYTSNISTEEYLEALDWVSERYKNNDTVLAYDLKNEPHGAGNESSRAIWNDSEDDNNWPYVASLAGNVILDNNPNALIVIEGNQIFPKDISSNNFTSMNEGDYYNTWWGGNLMGVKDYPVDLGSEERNRQIVYSPHDYGPAVYQQPWFQGGFTYDSLMEDCWYDYWFYIQDQDIAPILIGEWGGFMSGDNLTWMTHLRTLIGSEHVNFTFWCFNANSGDTGGLVLDDFTTWDLEKYDFVKEVLWTDSNGNFVGLDHVIPLGTGGNGVSLSDYSGITPPSAVINGEVSNPSEISESSETSSTVTESVTESETSAPEEPASESADGEHSESATYGNERNGALKNGGGIEPGLKAPLIILAVAAGMFILFLAGRFIMLKCSGLTALEALKRLFKMRI